MWFFIHGTWLGYTVGMLLRLLSEISWALNPLWLGFPRHPSFADALWFASYIPFLVALLLQAWPFRDAFSGRDLRISLAVTILTMIVILIIASTVVKGSLTLDLTSQLVALVFVARPSAAVHYGAHCAVLQEWYLLAPLPARDARNTPERSWRRILRNCKPYGDILSSTSAQPSVYLVVPRGHAGVLREIPTIQKCWLDSNLTMSRPNCYSAQSWAQSPYESDSDSKQPHDQD